MRKIFSLVCLMAVSAFLSAQSLLVEDFTGLTTGATLVGQSSWVKGGSGPEPTVQNSTPLTYAGYNGGGGEYVQMPAGSATSSRVYKPFTTTPAGTNTFYYSFLLNLSATTATGDYFITLGDPGTGSSYFGRVFAKTNGAGYNIGVTKLANVASAVFGSTVFNYNQTYLVVVRYSFVTGTSNDEVYVWVNPALTSEPATASALAFITTTASDPSNTTVGNFHWHNRTANNPTGSFDGVRIAYGATSADAWTALNASTVVTPSLSVSALTTFGNVCINTESGPNSFTVSGTNLTTADVTVGALAGYSYSTTAGGTYTSSLTIPQPGGTFSQTVYVKFTPTAVQSYNGNIPVAGGGVSTAVNAAATGAGINTAATVTSDAASAITPSTATVAGTVTATGCSALTAYGIEYSTTAGFPNGSGTAVASTNISAGSFTSSLTGLAASTIYYYHAYATNGGGTSYGAEQTFTTAAAVPVLSAGTLAAFGNVCINTTAGPSSFTISGVSLTNADVTVAALAGYTYSTTAGGTYTTTLTLTQPGGTYSQDVFVKFDPTAVQSYSGNIVVGGGGATDINVAASGAGVNTMATVTSGAASAITQTTATIAGAVTANGCSSVTAYGIEYSTTLGFPNGTGTAVASTNISGGNFSSDIAGLSSGITYYYHAYASNAGGTAYGAEQNFTTASPNPVITVTSLYAFGNVCINTTAGPNSFTINGTNLTTADITVAALPGFTYSTTAGGTYTSTLTLTQPGGTYSQDVFVKFSPIAVQSYNGNIAVNGAGIAAVVNVPASGAGVNTLAVVTTGSSSAITATSATLAGTVSDNGCSALTAYGIEYSTTAGFPNGSGTTVVSTNIAGVNFSAALSGLATGTVYYYHAYATNNGGTAYGAEQTFTTLTPVVSATALASFGNVCLNTTAGPGSFTITGTNLSTANVTVGPLAAYTFSTTIGGPYTASLSLVQPGGSFSQQVFVQFIPTAVQSYNGNIPVAGGGLATAVNVAATGAGVNSPATVTTGAASSLTYNSATAAGTITATGCTAITAYGIEYSTVNGFANGTGTSVASTNLSAGAFSSNLTGLAASTVYYFKAWATNGGGTAWGVQQTFTTPAVPISLTATALTAFGPACINSSAGPNSFTINGAFLTTANVNVGPLAGYTFSTTAGGTYTASLSLVQPGGTYTQQVFVKFNPTAVQAYTGNIPVAGGGFATTVNVAASGSGVNNTATVITGTAVNITTQSALVAGQVITEGCSPVTSYGIEWSGSNGFANGTGTPVAGTSISSGNFTVPLTGLVQGATYYYHAYAVNNGGTAYGPQQSFTVASISNGFQLFPNPVQRGTDLRITVRNIKPGFYGMQLFNDAGQRVYQWNMSIQSTYINQTFTVPATLQHGIYRAYLVSDKKEMGVITILVY
jgi:hypothetical protein